MYSSEGQNKDKRKSKTLLNFDFFKEDAILYLKKCLRNKSQLIISIQKVNI